MAQVAPDEEQRRLIEEAAQSFRSAGRELNRAPIGPGPGGRALRMLGKTAFFLRSMGDDEAADWARLVVSTGMILRAIGDIRLAQGRLRDQEAALLAVRKLDAAFDLAIGVTSTADRGLRLAMREAFIANNPWASVVRTESGPALSNRPVCQALFPGAFA